MNSGQSSAPEAGMFLLESYKELQGGWDASGKGKLYKMSQNEQPDI